MSRIRKGDLVFVRTGDDKGKRGRVLRVLPEEQRCVPRPDVQGRAHAPEPETW